MLVNKLEVVTALAAIYPTASTNACNHRHTKLVPPENETLVTVIQHRWTSGGESQPMFENVRECSRMFGNHSIRGGQVARSLARCRFGEALKMASNRYALNLVWMK